MTGRKTITIMVLVAALAAVSSWAQNTSFVGVPISGTYYEPVISDTVEYSGEIRLIQAPKPDGTLEWRVSGLLVDARSLNGRQRFTYIGLEQKTLDGAPGQVENLSLSFLATTPGSSPAFSGALAVPLSVPRDAPLAMVSPVSAKSGEGSLYMEFPIYGSYFEPALQDWVAYAGAVHVNVVPATPAPGWMELGMLVADAKAMGSGARFTYHGISRDHTDTLPGTLNGLTQTFWTTSAGGGADFGGTLTITANQPWGDPRLVFDGVTVASTR